MLISNCGRTLLYLNYFFWQETFKDSEFPVNSECICLESFVRFIIIIVKFHDSMETRSVIQGGALD